MPYRRTPIIKGEIYHIFNRSVGRQPIFLTDKHYKRALEVINFYSFHKPSIRFSLYHKLPKEQREEFLKNLQEKGKKLVEWLAYCLMPNHFHFLVRELEDNGISNLLRNFQNSYAKYFNTREERSGALFQAMFKEVRVETDEQLIHLVRYIHLNPYTAYLVKELREIEGYKWSSFREYVSNKNNGLVYTSEILRYFPSLKDFRQFTLDQANYQRKLDEIKHLTFE